MKVNHRPTASIMIGILVFSLLVSACSTGTRKAGSPPDAPSGEKIAFSAWEAKTSIANYEIYTMNIDGTGLTNLTNSDASETYPVYSPDGKKIAYCSDANGKSELYLMNEDGSNQHRMTDQVKDCGNPPWSSPVWSPDGKWIAISTTIGGTFPAGKMDIFVIRSDESHMYNLTNDPSNDLGYSWSPDSKKIAFASDREGNLDIYVVGVDGKELTRLTDDKNSDGQPVWSPDGKQLAFKSNRLGAMEIFVMDADGANQVQVTEDGAINSNPTWGPDGKALYYASNTDGNIEIYRIGLDGKNHLNLTQSKDDDYWFWLSPDGSQIVYSSCLAGCLEGVGTWNTSIMNSDGSDKQVLLKSEASVSWKP